MNELNNRFLLELFINKQVQCYPEVYNKAFHTIWPCESLFREFLSCSTTDLKIDYAKKIYGYMRAVEDVILPEFTINNVLDFQTQNLVTSNKGYVPQDHVIHCINLYILGVYLFFSFPLFNKRILSQDTSTKTLDKKVIDFVKKWKIFSLYHDVGYFLEGNIDSNGRTSSEVFIRLEQYRRIYSFLLYEYITRSVARSITTAAIIQRSRRLFSHDNLSINNKSWKAAVKTFTNEEVLNELSSFDGATILDDIQTERAFSHFVTVLRSYKVLVIIYDNNELPVGFVVRLGNQIIRLFIEKESILDYPEIYNEMDCDSLFERIPNGCTLKYCIYNASEVAYSHLPIEYVDRAKRCYKQLPESLRLPLSLATTDDQINQCFYKIYCWLIDKAGKYVYTDEQIPEFEIYKKNKQKYYQEATKDCLTRHIENIVNNTDSEEIGRSESMLQTIAMSISSESNIARLSSEIYKKAEKLYDNEEGVSHDMITYYADTYHNALHGFVQDNTNTSLGANTTGLKLLDALQFIRINSNNEVEVDVFNHGNQDIEKKFYEHIRGLSIGLDIDLNELASYSTKFTNCDHGVISACLLFQATLFSYYLAQYSKKHQDIQLAWHGLAGYDDLLNGKCMDDYAEVIFAILLHNVYTHESNPEYGVVYQHSIDNNMFSFFCAFCDTFQKWHRPKQIDHSRTSLPDKHFLGEKFDLIITEDKICLKCNTQDAIHIRQSLIEEDKYLPGIKHFVQIVEY